jgi:hypothetical protein
MRDGFSGSGERMTDYYGPFDHPVLADLPPATTDFFTEMDGYADAFRQNPLHTEMDDEIGFRQLQKIRLENLSAAESRDLYELWRLQYDTRPKLKAAELLRERDALFSERASASPDAIARIDVRLRDIGNEIASAFEARDGRAIATWP